MREAVPTGPFRFIFALEAYLKLTTAVANGTHLSAALT